ncbi:hypothetical protein U0070_027336 [Myodes glareolus]|uniref:Uncharacterized protein n=1 Tax=Myodes glareolus TaxID=447135 RepID=A0AAW0I2F1_MYOGA
MAMCHEGCQSVKENLLPVSDAQDKQLQEMNNEAEWLRAASLNEGFTPGFRMFTVTGCDCGKRNIRADAMLCDPAAASELVCSLGHCLVSQADGVHTAIYLLSSCDPRKPPRASPALMQGKEGNCLPEELAAGVTPSLLELLGDKICHASAGAERCLNPYSACAENLQMKAVAGTSLIGENCSLEGGSQHRLSRAASSVLRKTAWHTEQLWSACVEAKSKDLRTRLSSSESQEADR